MFYDRMYPPVLRPVLPRALILACVALAVGVAAQAVILPDGFVVQPVVLEPFGGPPAGFSFLPDGRVVLVEKSGGVRLATSGSTTSSLLTTIPGVTSEGERGLLGVAVDPQWPARPYVYFYGTFTDSTAHVTMYTAGGDLTDPASTNLTLASPYLVLNTIRDQYSHHNGGTLRFGPDGCLYASCGDDGSDCYAQVLDQQLGQILRLDVSLLPGSGTGPPPLADITPADNPFSGTPRSRLVFAYGLRNPFRFTIDPETGNLYIGDVGLLSWEEIHELVYTGFVGANCGWPIYEGNMATGYPCPEFPPFTPPIHVYPNPPDPATAAVVGGPIYHRVPNTAASFPFEYEGNLFLADFYAGWIRRLVRTQSGWEVALPVPGQPDADSWARDFYYFSDMQMGPDGGLYLLKLNTFQGMARGLYRIVDTRATDVPSGITHVAVLAVPNPAPRDWGTSIRLDLPHAEAVELRIYDVAGRHVRRFSSPSGASLHWDGRRRDGSPVPPGLYLYKVKTRSGWQAEGKISIVR